MRRTNTFFTFFLFISCFKVFGQNAPGNTTEWQKPPVLPILVSWDQEGLNIQAEKSLVSNPEAFNVEISGDLELLAGDVIRVEDTDFYNPVYIELDKFFGESKDANGKTMQKPVIKIDKEGKSRRINENANAFVLELRNFNGQKKQEFIVNGIDVFLIETNGNTKIEAYDKKIILDVADSQVNQIMFRGGKLKINDFLEKIPQLCMSYNEKYQELNAFTVQDSTLNEENDWKIQHVRDLITKYDITDFRDQPLAYLGDLIITKNGIGFKVKDGEFKKGGGWTKYSKDYIFKFFKWEKFINLEFSKFYDDKQFKIMGPYNNYYLHDGNEFFSNVEMIQFLKELNYTISSTMY